MTKKTRTESIALAVLLAGIVLVYFFVYRENPVAISNVTASADTNFKPIGVENPALKLNKLRDLHQTEYTGRHRNIFSETPPPPPAPPAPRLQPGPQLPPPPPPLTVDVKFYGYVDDPSNGQRRAFFTNGDDVFIVGQGEVLEGRFRLVRVGNESADVEEVSSGRRATLSMVQPDQAQ